jgi:hypothetical protein
MKVVAFVTRGPRKIKKVPPTLSSFQVSFFQPKLTGWVLIFISNQIEWPRRFDRNASSFDRPHILSAPKATKTSATHFFKQNSCFKFPLISLCLLHQLSAKREELEGRNLLTESA